MRHSELGIGGQPVGVILGRQSFRLEGSQPISHGIDTLWTFYMVLKMVMVWSGLDRKLDAPSHIRFSRSMSRWLGAQMMRIATLLLALIAGAWGWKSEDFKVRLRRHVFADSSHHPSLVCWNHRPPSAEMPGQRVLHPAAPEP